MKLTKLTKTDLILIFSLLGLYFLTRIPNLLALPIFTDEAIYIRWSQIGSRDAAWRFMPLIDGKPPLYHWFLMVLLKTPIDPLYAGRAISVISGFFSTFIFGVLGYVLTQKKKLGYLASLLYIFSPFMHVYDRLAVVDSLLTTLSITTFLFAYLLATTLRFDTALLLGMSIGASLLTKTSGLIFNILTPLHLIFLQLKPKKTLVSKLFTYVLFLVVSTLIGQAIYSILRLSQFFYRIDQKNMEFIIPLSEFLRSPFAMTWGNLKSLIRWEAGYLTMPVILLIILALTQKKWLKQKLILLGYFFIPLVMIASFNKVIFPRFLVFSTPFLLLLASMGFYDLLKKANTHVLKAIVVFMVIASPLVTIIQLITDPVSANIPQSERNQLIDSWPAGWGTDETVAFLRQKAQNETIFVGTQGTFGLYPFSLEIYLDQNKNIEIKSYWPVDDIPEEVEQIAKQKPTYFIYNELEKIPLQDNLELVFEFKKGRGNRYMRLYQVIPQP